VAPHTLRTMIGKREKPCPITAAKPGYHLVLLGVPEVKQQFSHRAHQALICLSSLIYIPIGIHCLNNPVGPKEFKYFLAANFIFVPTALQPFASAVPVITLLAFRKFHTRK
jgi:hypothetical protein